jgi:hypothetical protein
MVSDIVVSGRRRIVFLVWDRRVVAAAGRYFGCSVTPGARELNLGRDYAKNIGL